MLRPFSLRHCGAEIQRLVKDREDFGILFFGSQVSHPGHQQVRGGSQWINDLRSVGSSRRGCCRCRAVGDVFTSRFEPFGKQLVDPLVLFFLQKHVHRRDKLRRRCCGIDLLLDELLCLFGTPGELQLLDDRSGVRATTYHSGNRRISIADLYVGLAVARVDDLSAQHGCVGVVVTGRGECLLALEHQFKIVVGQRCFCGLLTLSLRNLRTRCVDTAQRERGQEELL